MEKINRKKLEKKCSQYAHLATDVKIIICWSLPSQAANPKACWLFWGEQDNLQWSFRFEPGPVIVPFNIMLTQINSYLLYICLKRSYVFFKKTKKIILKNQDGKAD